MCVGREGGQGWIYGLNCYHLCTSEVLLVCKQILKNEKTIVLQKNCQGACEEALCVRRPAQRDSYGLCGPEKGDDPRQTSNYIV